MFLRSKYETTPERENTITINNPVSTDNLKALWCETTGGCGNINIVFDYHDSDRIVWEYLCGDDRLKEYNWILSQLDCRVNEEDATPTITESLKINPCKCGGQLFESWNESQYEIECSGCKLKIWHQDKAQTVENWNSYQSSSKLKA